MAMPNEGSPLKRLHITLAELKLKPIANLVPKVVADGLRPPPPRLQATMAVGSLRKAAGVLSPALSAYAQRSSSGLHHMTGVSVLSADAPRWRAPRRERKETIRRRRRVTTTVSSNDAAVATGSLPAA
jgi:hypothetical protein